MLDAIRTVLSYVRLEQLPDDWELLPVGDLLLETQYGMNAPSSVDGNTAIVGMKDIKGGNVLFNNLARANVSDAELTSYCLHSGDLLINRTNSLDQVGKVGIVRSNVRAVFASYLVRLIVDRAQIEPGYLNYWLNTDSAQRTIKRIATPAIGQTNVNPTEFQKYCLVPLPPISQQNKIFEILSSWDDAIDRKTRIVAAKLTAQSAALRTIFGETHIQKSERVLMPLSAITDRVSRKADGANHPVMTISGKAGFLRQDEKFSRFMAGKSVERYTLLKRGEFAYNKGNSITYPQGCIYCLNQDTALVPHVYISFRLHDGLNGDFYAHLFQAGFLNRQLARLINSGVRNDGLLNLNIKDFFGCRVPVPSADEQARVAGMLGDMRREIRLLERELDCLKKQKRGLMQKLLTGEWRVPVRDGEVEEMAVRAAEEVVQ
jgi:type I restriction enzyme S subunit